MDDHVGYSGHRKIPRKIAIYGNRDKGQNYIGMADSQLCILENLMATGRQTVGSRTVKLEDGHIVEAWRSMNMSGVNIYTPDQEPETEPHGHQCFCTCHVATGYIVQYANHDCPDMSGGWPGRSYPKYYDVRVCERKTEYVLIQNVLPMSLSSYRNGQEVLVVFQPATGEPYVPHRNQGCDVITCRLTDILETHDRYFHEL